MYDAQTANLIRQAPELAGLDRDRLAEDLTDAFTQIVALRLRLVERESDDDLDERLDKLQRLANTYENLALSTDDRTLQSASAFVSATAHHLLALAQKQLYPNDRLPRALSEDAVSPQVSALLLFLIAGYPSDAAEIARGLNTGDAPDAESAIVQCLSALGLGALSRVLAFDTESEDPVSEGFEESFAIHCLWKHILGGLRALVAEILDQGASAGRTAEQYFEETRDLSTEDLEVEIRTEARRVLQLSAFAGPHHLATLLLAVAGGLRAQAVTRVPPPRELDPDEWRDYLRSLAEMRPFLWANHRVAIDQGYLDPGTSACVSFPTGAGKSMLAELKIATCMQRTQPTVYLAPTHALVGQVAQSLRRAFPSASVHDSVVAEGYYTEVEDAELPDIAVMTPERCLMFLGLYPEAFSTVGLLVFDECHLLHPARGLADRRSIDAMMCFLHLLSLAQDMDVLLLSAMMANGPELARWLEETLARPCLGLDLEWKPTRQARGCVIYKSDEIEQIRNSMNATRAALLPAQRQRPPGVAVRRELNARPHGLFCLKQTWNTVDVDDYKAVPLLTETVQLESDNRWRLTGNKNAVAAQLASQMARVGMKTIVFSQNRVHCESIARRVASNLDVAEDQYELSDNERKLLEIAVEECGGSEHVFTPYGTASVVHHGLLMPVERHLSESVFSRADGACVIVATPTLAQGMNLPAEVVIIAGSDRFDADSGRAAQIGAHELLNAAGRAGRAGFAAQGLVVVVPTEVIEFDANDNSISAGWARLREGVFAKTDQCLEIADPLTLVLDHIQVEVGEPSPDALYCINRLPLGDASSDDAERSFLRRSFAAWQARQRGELEAFEERVGQVVELRRSLLADRESISDLDRIACASGQSVELIAKINHAIMASAPGADASTQDWINWVMDQAAADLAVAQRAFGHMGSLDLFGVTDAAITLDSVEAIREHLQNWMLGSPLADIERAFGTTETQLRKCVKARKLIRDCVPHVSYLAGIVAMVYKNRLSTGDILPLPLATLGSCVRDGFDRPEKLAVQHVLRAVAGRVQCHAAFEEHSEAILAEGVTGGSFQELCEHVKSVLL